MANDKFLFFRVAWMKKYQGLTEDDMPAGGGSHIDDTGSGGEIVNFLPHRGKYYGYSHVSKYGVARIEKIGAHKDDEYIDGVTVILFAKDPYKGGERVVGWYKDARVLRQNSFKKDFLGLKKKWYNVIADVSKSKCIPAPYRNLEIPQKAAGRSNLWYGNARFIKRVKEYIRTYNEKKLEAVLKAKGGDKKNWQPDIEKRKKIENHAMEAVEQYYYQNGFEEVLYVHNEKFGWDMEAHYGKRKLLVEVKGLQGKLDSVELTHNEYSQAKAKRKEFRLCVVPFALDNKKKKVYEFSYTGKGGKWKNIEGQILKTQTLIAARLFKI